MIQTGPDPDPPVEKNQERSKGGDHMKKWISMLLVIAMILGVMAGCGTSGKGNDSDKGKSDQGQEESLKSEEGQSEA